MYLYLLKNGISGLDVAPFSASGVPKNPVSGPDLVPFSGPKPVPFLEPNERIPYLGLAKSGSISGTWFRSRNRFLFRDRRTRALPGLGQVLLLSGTAPHVWGSLGRACTLL